MQQILLTTYIPFAKLTATVSHVTSMFYLTAAPSPARSVTITRVFQDGVELNWLPPTEPNGEVHYVIEYKREDSGDWTSVNTTSDSTHYNLTGLHSGTRYIIRVVVVNAARRPMSPTTPGSNSTNMVDIGVIVPGATAFFLLLLILLTAGVAIGMALRMAKLRAQGRQVNTAENYDNHQLKNHTAAAIEEQESTADYSYAYVNDESSVGQTEGHYQELDVSTQDYMSVYAQLGVGLTSSWTTSAEGRRNTTTPEPAIASGGREAEEGSDGEEVMH